MLTGRRRIRFVRDVVVPFLGRGIVYPSQSVSSSAFFFGLKTSDRSFPIASLSMTDLPLDRASSYAPPHQWLVHFIGRIYQLEIELRTLVCLDECYKLIEAEEDAVNHDATVGNSAP